MNSPTFSVLMPTYNPKIDLLFEAVNSVIAQSFTDWELVIHDDGSIIAENKEALDQILKLDSRIKVTYSSENKGIGHASQQTLLQSSGQWVTTLDQDDLLTPDALSIAALELHSGPTYGFAYSDSCKLNANGELVEIFRKPDWSIERLRGNMYVAHMFVYSRELALRVGGYREKFSGSQDHDLALRLAETKCAVLHIPRVLYIWRISENSTSLNPDAKPYAQVNGEIAVREHLERMQLKASVIGVADYPGFYSLNRINKEDQSVSIIIPTRGTKARVFGREEILVLNLLHSIKSKPQKSLLEIILVVDTGSECDIEYIEKANKILPNLVRVVEYNKPFNFSEKINIGINNSDGKYVLILNDDIELISDSWLDQMQAIVEQSDVGSVGPLLLFENGLIQHGGHFYAYSGATHKYLKQMENPGEFGDLIIEHEVSGLTGAFMLFSRENWQKVGGFSESFPNNFNDVDFSLKLRAMGLRNIFTPLVRAYHFESLTRKPNVQSWEVAQLQERWGYLLETKREPFGPGGKPPYFGNDRLNWDLRGIYLRLRRVAANIYKGRRPIFRIS